MPTQTQSKQLERAVGYAADDIGELQKRVGALEYLHVLDHSGDEESGDAGDDNTNTDTHDDSADNALIVGYELQPFWADVQRTFRQPVAGLVDNGHLDMTDIVLVLREDERQLGETVELPNVD